MKLSRSKPVRRWLTSLWGERCERDVVGRQQQPRFREWPSSAAWWFACLQCLRHDALPGLHFQKGWKGHQNKNPKTKEKEFDFQAVQDWQAQIVSWGLGDWYLLLFYLHYEHFAVEKLPRLSWRWWQWWSPPHTLTSEIWAEVNKWMCGNCFVPRRVGSQAPAKNKVYVVSESTWRTALTCIARRPTLPCVRNVIVRNQKECGYQQDAHTGVVGQPWTITLRRNVSNWKPIDGKNVPCSVNWFPSLRSRCFWMNLWNSFGNGQQDVLVGKNLCFYGFNLFFSVWANHYFFVEWMVVDMVYGHQVVVSWRSHGL